MKYKNAKNIFPDDILEELQKYVQGEYVYIPIKDKASSYVRYGINRVAVWGVVYRTKRYCLCQGCN